MDEPQRHRSLVTTDVERVRRMSPAERLEAASELAGLTHELSRAGREQRWQGRSATSS